MAKKKRSPGPKRLSDQIREAIATSGVSRYRIAKETGIGQSALSRFMGGERGLSMKALDTLAAFLGFHLTTRPAEFSGSADRTHKHQ